MTDIEKMLDELQNFAMGWWDWEKRNQICAAIVAEFEKLQKALSRSGDAAIDGYRGAIKLLKEKDARIAELEVENQRLFGEIDTLAREQIYRGNSVWWWHCKARAYGDALLRAWDALHKAGIDGRGQLTVADGIRHLTARAGK